MNGSDDKLFRFRVWLSDLRVLVAARAEGETAIEQRYHKTLADAEREDREIREHLERAASSETEAATDEHNRSQARIEAWFAHEDERTRRAHEVEQATIVEKGDHSETTARRKWDESVWAAETVYEAKEDQPDDEFEATRKTLDGRLAGLESIGKQACEVIRRSRIRPPAPLGDDAGEDYIDNADHTLDQGCSEACAHLDTLRRVHLMRLFGGGVPFIVLSLPAVAVGVAIGLIDDWQPNARLIGAVSAALVVTAGLVAWCYVVARSRARAVYRSLDETLRRCRHAHQAGLDEAQRRRERAKAELIETRDREIREAQARYAPIISEIDQRRAYHMRRIEDKYPKRVTEIREKYETDLADSDEQHRQRLAQAKGQYEQAIGKHQAGHAPQIREIRQRYEKNWSALETSWKTGLARCRAEAKELDEAMTSSFPPWQDEAWTKWTPGTSSAWTVPFGKFDVDIERLPGGLPVDKRLIVPGATRFDMPAMLSLPQHCSLLLESGPEGRDRALQTLQTVMMRLLIGIPPGKVRFTILDPIGLGQNFAGFMHLADYNDALVDGKIWTETRHIEQRLADVTEHMENVIQKYLRNEYETIAQYNRDAGEIAEPYRFVVVSDFPANFSEPAARRLSSILSSGPRCGVYALIFRDTRQKLPQGIGASELADNTINLIDRDGRFVWKDKDFEGLPLSLDTPADEAFVTSKLHLIGQGALDASRVEVPFEVVAPDKGRRWKTDAASLIRVPLGRAGASRLQYLTLGKGTNQHVLIAGKTGSGKSTLLHVLITNLALWYSPDDVELYLVDFKKGVEFKTYATHALPHARAIAIESDREFGLSVLQRLDGELKRRGEIFRKLGVQDIAGYLNADNHDAMPRTLLIVDEFQEFFVEDDKIAQDAALLLDRLVRQGRAFGIHVLLGSQTLGGAYTLARSTLGQMGVRIALQCGETDSYLILSDDNAAARLLARPGEAIYNDANGQVEGNSPFQVVWLGESKRDRYLDEIHEMAERSPRRRPVEPPIVFEGSAAAAITNNHRLAQCLGDPSWPAGSATPAAPLVWLGEPVSIKEATSVALPRHSGSNLLIVGQRDDAALAMLTTSLVSLAAQLGPRGAHFVVFDGTPADSPHAGYLQKVASVLPHDVRLVGRREVEETIGELAGHLQERMDGDRRDAPPIFIVINALQRFRMLRPAEATFSFSSSDEAGPSVGKQFGDLMREGPVYGMHLLTWCDSATNLERAIERQGLREFDHRVLFQMGSNDSTNLIDSPVAGKLGFQRALLANEERGTLEKFRPYAVPDEAWLEEVRSCLAGKSETAATINVLAGLRKLFAQRSPPASPQ